MLGASALSHARLAFQQSQTVNLRNSLDIRTIPRVCFKNDFEAWDSQWGFIARRKE